MGRRKGLSERLAPEDETVFPNLRTSDYRVESPPTERYNCVAHAAGDQNHKWACPAVPEPGYYWPEGAERGDHVEALVSAFVMIGYQVCTDGALEEGYEKVALYVDADGYWSHVAKQEQDGSWSSKLGDREDIRHASEHAFAGSLYGQVVHYMSRSLAVQAPPPPPVIKRPTPRGRSRKRRSRST
jgi:hypothetical protein